MARQSSSNSAGTLLARKSWGTLPAVMLLSGNAGFFKTRIVERAKRELFGESSAEVQKYTATSESDPPLSQVLDDLRTPSFFSPRRLVVIEKAEIFIKTYRDDLLPYVESGFATGHLILTADGKVDGRTKFAKAVHATGWSISCDQPYDRPPPWSARQPVWDSPLSHWIVAHARGVGLRIDAQRAFQLHDRVGTDLQTIDEELEKIFTFLAESGDDRVTEKVIAKVCGDLREDSIFSLVDLLLEGRRTDALRSARRLIEKGYHDGRGVVTREPHAIVLPFVGASVTRLRALRRAHAMSKAGASTDDWIRSGLVQKPFLARFQRQVSATSPSRIQRLFRRLYELDRGLKTGQNAAKLLTLVVLES